MKIFFEQLDRRFVQTNQVCELDSWLQMFAFDVMGEITFSKRLGFLERGEDVDGIMASIWNNFLYTAPVSGHNPESKQAFPQRTLRSDKCLGLMGF